MGDETPYEHLFKQSSASLTGPVDIAGILTLTWNLTSNNIYTKAEVDTLTANNCGGSGSLARISESTNLTDISGGAYGISLKSGTTVLVEVNTSFLTSTVNFQRQIFIIKQKWIP